MVRKLGSAVAIAIALGAATPFEATAGLLVQLVSVSPASGAFLGDYFWSYSLTIDNGDTCSYIGCYFTIYDFGNTVTVEPPTGWTDSLQNSGVTPSGLSPTDNSTIRNVTFTYPGTLSGTGQTIPDFNIVSPYGNVASGQFSWLDQNGAGALQDGTADVGIPSPTGTSAPEPGTFALLGLGLAGLAASRRRKQ